MKLQLKLNAFNLRVIKSFNFLQKRTRSRDLQLNFFAVLNNENIFDNIFKDEKEKLNY